MVTIKLPEKVQYIIGELRADGFEAFAVGGCVRDSLLGRVPGDWDITTNAAPAQVKQRFPHTIDTGIEHGTVTVMLGRDGFEVTTYRIDGEYVDARHPKQVSFTGSLTEDLRRRDFTINAMAYSDETGLIDVFGGMHDLRQRLIRCVGRADDRFGEDALRIMRAVRFSAQLDFSIEPETLRSIAAHSENLRRISVERIRTELTKLLLSDHPERLLTAQELGLTRVFLPEFDRMLATTQENPHHIYNVGMHTIRALQYLVGRDVRPGGGTKAAADGRIGETMGSVTEKNAENTAAHKSEHPTENSAGTQTADTIDSAGSAAAHIPDHPAESSAGTQAADAADSAGSAAAHIPDHPAESSAGTQAADAADSAGSAAAHIPDHPAESSAGTQAADTIDSTGSAAAHIPDHPAESSIGAQAADAADSTAAAQTPGYAAGSGKLRTILRYAVLLHDVGKPEAKTVDESGRAHFYRHADIGAARAAEILRRLKFDNDTVSAVSRLIELHDYRYTSENKTVSERTVRRAVSRIGAEWLETHFLLQEADLHAQNPALLPDKLRQLTEARALADKVLSAGHCISLKMLAVNGRDLIAAGYPSGKSIGAALEALLNYVLEHPEENTRTVLLARAAEMREALCKNENKGVFYDNLR